MIGAIIGDIIGSRFEFNNTHSTNFQLFGAGCNFTDDTILTIAVADAIINHKPFGETLHTYGNHYRSPMGGFGGSFLHWLSSPNPQPYDSLGNGSAMRVSACAKLARTRQEALELAALSCMPTHNHPEGIRGAMAITDATFALLHKASKNEALDIITNVYGYDISYSCAKIRHHNAFNETCPVTVPQAVIAFAEGHDFESAIRLAVSLGGDSDTIAAMCGPLAEALYGIPVDIEKKAIEYLPSDFISIIRQEYK